MPEYFHPVSPNTGIAEETARLRLEAAKTQSSGITQAAQSIMEAFKARSASQAGQIDPAKVQQMMEALRGQGPTTPVQIGQNRTLGGNITMGGPMSGPSGKTLPVSAPMPKLNPAEASLAERMAAAKEATARAESVAGTKGQQGVDLEAAKAHHAQELQTLKDQHAQELAEVKAQAAAAKSEKTISLKDEQLLKKQWVSAGKDMDINTASSRSPLGVAVTNNQKASRAMKLLNTKGTFTPEDKRLITTDLAAMMKGGVPDKDSEAGQKYGSLLEDFVGVAAKVTASPKNLDVPEIRNHLREVMRGIVDVDNTTIKDHIDQMDSKYMDAAAWRPKEWEKMRGKALKHVIEDSSAGDIDALLQEFKK